MVQQGNRCHCGILAQQEQSQVHQPNVAFTTDRWGLNFFGLLQLAPPTGRCALAELLEQPGPWGSLEEVVDGAEANADSEKIKNCLVGCNQRLSRADCGNRRRFGIAVCKRRPLPLKFA